MTRFRHPAALLVTALLALIGSISLTAAGDWRAAAPLVPLAAVIWILRSGTDVNEYGIRVRALLGRRVIPWSEVAALVPDQRGRAFAALTSGRAVPLTAVRATDIPRVIAASGKTPADG